MKHFIPVLLTTFLFWQCSSKDQKPANKSVDLNTTVVVTVHPETAEGNTAVSAIGVITNGQEAKPSFKTGGVVSATYFEEGDYVKKGQLLAKLNLSEIDAQLFQANEALQKAERDYGRAKRLHADSVATLEQVQNAATAVELAKKTKDIILFNRQYSEVRSPINGRIVKQILHTGEMAGPGMPVCAIIGTGNGDWKVKAGFIDRDWLLLKNGQKASFVLDADPQQKYDVTLVDKAVIAGNASSLIDAEFSFSKRPENLAIGLLGKITINPSSGAKIMTLPIECLTQSNGNTSYVFIHENGKAKLRKITTAKLMGDKVEVIEGITPEDEVIATGAMYLEDGDVVKIKP